MSHPRWSRFLVGWSWYGLRMVAGEKLAAATRSVELSVRPDNLAARDRRHRPSPHAHALVGRVVHVVVEQVIRDRDLLVRVPNGEVSVGANRDRSLARIKAVHLGGVGRGQRDELAEVDAPLANSGREEKRQTRLEARNPVRNTGEARSRPRDLLALRIVVTERRVVGGEDLEETVS